MEPPVSVKSRAHRTLRKIGRFVPPELSDASSEPWLDLMALRSGEERIGVYINPPGSRAPAVGVTTEALWLLSKESRRRIAFSEMDQVDSGPHEEPDFLDTLHLRLASGEKVVLPVEGGEERFRDAWEVMRFLMRVIDDQKQVNGP